MKASAHISQATTNPHCLSLSYVGGTLLAALVGEAFFYDIQWTANFWLPEILIFLATFLLCLKGHLWARCGRTEWIAATLLVWCVIVDVWQGTWGITNFLWQTALLFFFLFVRTATLRQHVLSIVIMALTIVCAFHEIGHAYGLVLHPLFNNSAGYAAALACGLPHLLYIAVTKHTWQRAFASIGCGLTLWAIALTSSRTAWFALLLASVGLILHNAWQRLSSIGRSITLASVVVVLSVSLIGLYNLRPASANGRLLIYRVAMNCISDAPIAGHGSDGILRDYMPTQADFLARHADHEATQLAGNVPYVFNEALGFTLKYGLVGTLLLGIGIFALLYEYSRNAAPYLSIAEQQLAVGEMLVFGGLCLFSYPLTYPYLCLMAICTTCMHKPRLAHAVAYRQHAHSPVAQSIVCATVCLIAIAALAERIVGESCWHKADTLARMGQTQRAFELFDKATKALPDHPLMAYNYAATLNLAGRYTKSHRELARCTLRLNDYDTEILAADNALAMKQYAVAEQHLRTASHMIPSRFMPLYGLLQVYENIGDTIRLSRVAHRILRHPIKVSSPDVVAIISEVRQNIGYHFNATSSKSPKR